MFMKGDTMNCKRCGAPVSSGATTCPSCGLENPIAYWQKANNTTQQQTTQTAQSTSQTPPNSSASSTQQQQTAASFRQPQTSAPAQKATTTTVQEKKSSPFKTILILAVIGLLIFGAIKLFGGGKLKGTWMSEDGSVSITFSDKDSGYFTYHKAMSSSQRTIDFTYFTEGDEIEIKTTATLYVNSKTERFEYKVSGKKLTLTEVDSGLSEVFTKK